MPDQPSPEPFHESRVPSRRPQPQQTELWRTCSVGTLWRRDQRAYALKLFLTFTTFGSATALQYP